jgi:hypothetical protein
VTREEVIEQAGRRPVLAVEKEDWKRIAAVTRNDQRRNLLNEPDPAYVGSWKSQEPARPFVVADSHAAVDLDAGRFDVAAGP